MKFHTLIWIIFIDQIDLLFQNKPQIVLFSSNFHFNYWSSHQKSSSQVLFIFESNNKFDLMHSQAIQSKEEDYLPSSNDKPNQKTKKYDTISFQTRQELIERVMKGHEKVSEAAIHMGIKLSTAKFIVRSFKRHGKIFRKKAISQAPSPTFRCQKSQIRQKNNFESEIKLVYYPIYIFVPLPPVLIQEQQKNQTTATVSSQQSFF